MQVLKLRPGFALPWWQGNTVEAMQGAILKIKTQDAGAYMEKFGKEIGAVNVYLSNKMEGTLAFGVKEQQTYKLVIGLLEASGVHNDNTPPSCSWGAEGHPSNGSYREQLLQHAKALRFLCYSGRSELTSHLVKETHKILMWGARDEEANLVKAGLYRDTGAHFGTGYVYPPPEVMKTGVEATVSKFNANLQKFHTGEMDMDVLAAHLFYKMVTLHPFENGNGRLCRLLVSFALQSAGEPFPLYMSNGHKKSRQHYQQILRHADAQCGNVEHLIWQNFRENKEWSKE